MNDEQKELLYKRVFQVQRSVKPSKYTNFKAERSYYEELGAEAMLEEWGWVLDEAKWKRFESHGEIFNFT